MDRESLKKFILTSLVLVLIFGVAYMMLQRALRESANDPQIQIAKDSAVVLARGEEPGFLRSNVYGQIDIAQSLAPFLITYDSAFKPLAASGKLDGEIPVPSVEAFAYAKKHGENKITWRLKKDVRIAMVLVYYGGARDGFVLSGRSLLEVEKRENMIKGLAVFGALISIFLAFIGYWRVKPSRLLTH